MALLENPCPPLKSPPRSFTKGGIVYRAAGPEDDDEVRAALRDNPMDGWVRLAFEREPTLVAGENRMGRSFTFVARDKSGALVGTYSLSHLIVHVNGRPEIAGYLGGLRVQPGERHKIRILKGGYASLEFLSPEKKTVPFYFTSIAHDNYNARRLLERRLNGMPIYEPVGELGTFLFRVRGKSRGMLQRAQAKDVPALVQFFNTQMARYQFSPVLSGEWLLNLNGEHGLKLSDFLLLKEGPTIRGCLALWDQRSFTQAVVKSYRFPLNITRPLVNLKAAWKGLPFLPKPGKRLNLVFLAFIAFDQKGEGEAVAAIQEVASIAFSQGIELCAFGLCPENPLAKRLKKIIPHSLYQTVIETVTPAGIARVPALEGPTQPEIALL